jgi:hypothetical protein
MWMAEEDFEEIESEEDAQSDVEERLEELESKVDELGRGAAAGGAAYSFGATLAMILSWHSFHAVLWALLAGILSWLYVVYYLVVNWATIKLI